MENQAPLSVLMTSLTVCLRSQASDRSFSGHPTLRSGAYVRWFAVDVQNKEAPPDERFVASAAVSRARGVERSVYSLVPTYSHLSISSLLSG
jgi:hypothetical protein